MTGQDAGAKEVFDWRGALRSWRRRQGFTQVALAKEARISPAAVRAYERGARHPSPQALTAIVRALGVPRQEANQIRGAAGYAVDWETLFDSRYVFDLEHAKNALERCPWPAFLTDQGVNLVAANRLFESVLDIDLESEFQEPGTRNLLAGCSDRRFADCLENFDEVISFMLGLAKGDPRLRQDMENPAPWLREAVSVFLDGDPQVIKRVLELWESAPPIAHSTRHEFEVRWLWRGKHRLRLLGVLTIADLWNEVSWNDWIPADAETWMILREIQRRSELTQT